MAQVPLQTPGTPPVPPGNVTGLSAGVNQMSAALVHAPEGELDDGGVFTGTIVGWVDEAQSASGQTVSVWFYLQFEPQAALMTNTDNFPHMATRAAPCCDACQPCG